jgi:hypothetical protein
MANDIRLRTSDYPDLSRSETAISPILTDTSLIDILQLFGISRDLLSPLNLRRGGRPGKC